MKSEIPKPPAGILSNNKVQTIADSKLGQTGSYAEFREKEFKPLQDELFKAIYPILTKNTSVAKLNEDSKKAFILDLSDRLTSDFFSKSFDYLKKQQKQEEIEALRLKESLRSSRIEKARNIPFESFGRFVTERLNHLVDERNPGKVFQFDEYCKNAFQLCLKYFHPASQSEMNRSKGICLLGKVGTGKSTLLTGFCDNPLSSFRIIKAQEIVEMYVQNPEQTFSRILSEKPLANEENDFGFRRYDLLIEEVGREQLLVNVKGESFKNTPVNVMEKFFLELYDRPGIRIHIVSNAEDFTKLTQLYGEAAASRIYEMFNTITFDAEAPNRRFL